MAAQDSRVAPTDVVRRRVVRAWYPDRDKPLKPQWVVFRPRPADPAKGDPGDVDGISVDRRSLATAEQTARGTDPARPPYHVASIAVATVESIRDSAGVGGLEVIASPTPDNLAHALIPKMNCTDYADPSKKARLIEWAKQLADQSEMVVVVREDQTLADSSGDQERPIESRYFAEDGDIPQRSTENSTNPERRSY